MKKILVDASSAILLFKSKLLEDFITRYDVGFSRSVFDELTREGYSGSREFFDLRDAGIIHVHTPLLSHFRHEGGKPAGLHRGEWDTILLYLEGKALFLVIDDGKGVRYCRDKNIPHIDALLVPKILMLAGCLSEKRFNETTGRILSLGRYSKQVIDFAENCAEKELGFFLPG